MEPDRACRTQGRLHAAMGGRGAARAIDPAAWEPLAPGALPFVAGSAYVPKAMTLADIERVQRDFADAARRAADAGFEWVALHFAHGFLGQEFLSTHANQRELGIDDPAPRRDTDRQEGSRMQRRKPGTLEVSALGAGRMSIGANDGPPADRAQGIGVIREAHGRGVTLFDTAEVYGPYTNEARAGEALASMLGKVAIASKFGCDIGLSAADLRAIDSAVARITVHGGRMNKEQMRIVEP